MDEVIRLLKQMKVGGGAVAPDAVTFTTVMDGYTRARQGELALRVFDRLQGLGIARDAVCYMSAISACASCGDWQRALLLL